MDTNARISATLAAHPVVLFMKGGRTAIRVSRCPPWTVSTPLTNGRV